MGGVETIVEDQRWRDAISEPEEFISRLFAASLDFEPSLSGEVAVLLANDAKLRELNCRFRGKDSTTNVLSFPSRESAPAFLGDIAVAIERCCEEASEKSISAKSHAAHLVVHGLLHLVGYDHEEDDEAHRMESLETEILGKLGYPNPYAVQEI